MCQRTECKLVQIMPRTQTCRRMIDFCTCPAAAVQQGAPTRLCEARWESRATGTLHRHVRMRRQPCRLAALPCRKRARMLWCLCMCVLCIRHTRSALGVCVCVCGTMHTQTQCVFVSQHSVMPSRSNSMSTQQLGMVLEARQFAQRVQDKLDAQFLEEVSARARLHVIDAASFLVVMPLVIGCDMR